MGTSHSRRDGSSKSRTGSKAVVIGVVLLGVAICIAVIFVWLQLFPTDTTEQNGTPDLVLDTTPVTQSEQHVPEVENETPKADTLSRAPSVPTPTPAAVYTPAQTESNPNAIVFKQHAVKEGETIETIAEQYEITKETLLSVNPIRNISALRPGEELTIPDRDGQMYVVQSGDSLSIITSRFNPTLGWKTLQEINGLKSEVIYPGQKLFIPSVKIEAEGSFATFDRFVRPATGRIIGLYGQTVRYGKSEDPVVLQGLWIEGSEGTQVIASATGVVVDAGHETDGLGRFVVLSHANGYRTIYGHLASVSVKVGDQVQQSDTIGTIGNSGNIEQTLLYFSLEQQGTALNPANFF